MNSAERARRIMIVDDDVDAGNALGAVLRLDGHDVLQLHDPCDIVAAALRFVPDAVLLDLSMPGEVGDGVARALRRQPETANTLLIAMTANSGANDHRRALRAGFDEHFVKPIDLAALRERLAREPLR